MRWEKGVEPKVHAFTLYLKCPNPSGLTFQILQVVLGIFSLIIKTRPEGENQLQDEEGTED